MNKHFLVTVSNDYEHLTGVEFICSFFHKKSKHHLTLLHICRLDAGDMNKVLLERWEAPEERVTGKPTIGAKKALHKARHMLAECSSMSVDKMITKTVAERYGKVKDILVEGTRGLYDAIILGKRASYALQWIFERPAEETAQAILADSGLSVPLWICPEPEHGRKDVLVGIDGSESSMRAVDHVGYILSRQTRHRITLYNVDGGGQSAVGDMAGRAHAILHEHDIADERITFERTWGLGVAGSLLGKAKSGGYAAIAVGLRGAGGGLLKRFSLAGGTTAKLVEKIDSVSLWCCP